MSPRSLILLVSAVVAAHALAGGAEAADRRSHARVDQVEPGLAHPKSSYYRRAPEVRGYVVRRGGYSYSPSDAINTYGDSRSLYGGASSYRHQFIDRQTGAGPFDHGFFFDSGIAPRGGDSPYMN